MSNSNDFFEPINYLLQKLEAKYNSILKFSKTIEESDSPESFFNLRQAINLFFVNLEEDFKQGIFAIKALLNLNNQKSEELNKKNKEMNKLVEQLNSILIENKELKLQINQSNEKGVPIFRNNKKINNELQIDTELKIDEMNINKEKEQKKIISPKRWKKNSEDKVNDKINNNKYEIERLSNVKNIMDNMKKNKIKLKNAIEQHFSKNQNN